MLTKRSEVLCHGQSLEDFFEDLRCAYEVSDRLINVSSGSFFEVFAGRRLYSNLHVCGTVSQTRAMGRRH